MTHDELAEKYTQETELHYKLLKAVCPTSLFDFNQYILGSNQGTNKVELAPFHEEICKFVQNRRDRKKLLLVPRGHLKSTLITVGYSVFRLVENPNTRILILSATWQTAVDFLTEIRNHLTRNETLKAVFGDIATNMTESSQDRITLNRSDPSVRGPSVWAAGVESNLVGSHPDLIIMDDLVNRDNCESKEAMDKVIMRYKDALDLLEPGGQLIVIGTRWTDRDLYEWILNPDNNIRQSYDVLVKPAFKSDFTLTEIFAKDGENLIHDHLWPQKFSYKELESRFREKGPYEFSAQYLNDAIPNEERDFKREWFHYTELEDWRGRNVACYMTVDPAISTAKYADFTVLTVTWVDAFGTILPIRIERVKVLPDQLINLIFQLAEVYHPISIGIEIVAFQKMLQYALTEQMKSRQRRLPLVELRMQDRTKEERIRGLQPLYANGKIVHSKAVRNTEILEDELLRFPRGKHDDVADCLSMQLELIVPPRGYTDEDAPRKRKYLYGSST